MDAATDDFMIRNVKGMVLCPTGNTGNNDNQIAIGPFDISSFNNIQINWDLVISGGIECNSSQTNPSYNCIAPNGRDQFVIEYTIDDGDRQLLYWTCDEPDDTYLNQLEWGLSLIHI